MGGLELGGLDLELEFKAEGLHIWVWIFGVWGSTGPVGKTLGQHKWVCTLWGWERRSSPDLRGGLCPSGDRWLSMLPTLSVIPQPSQGRAGPPPPSLSWLGLSLPCLCLFGHLCVRL